MTYIGSVVPIPIGVDGLYGIARIPITGLLTGRNVTLDTLQIEKEPGATSQNATPITGSPSIDALYDWWSDAATQRTIAVSRAGGVYRDTGSWSFSQVLAAATLTISGQPPHVVAGGAESPGRNRKLIILTGATTPYVGSGDFTTMAAISSPPADWTGSTQPRCGCIHQNRFWAALGHLIYYSTTDDHENVSGGGVLAIAPGDGLYISAMVSFRGMLVVFKYPRGIYIVDTSAANINSWRYDAQSTAVGTGGPWSAVAIPNDVLFLDIALNVHLLSATNVTRDAASSDISTPKLGSIMRDNFDANRATWVQAHWFGNRRQAIVALAGLGATTNNRKLYVDFNDARLGPKFTWSDRDVTESLMMRLVSGIPTPYAGDNAGTVWALDRSARTKDGVGYNGVFQLDHTDFADVDAQFAGRKKNFDYLEFEFDPTSGTLSINVYVDGKLKTLTPLSISLTGGGVALGTFLIGTDRLVVSSAKSRKRVRLRWRGTRISVEAYSAATNNFRVSRAFIGCRVAE